MAAVTVSPDFPIAFALGDALSGSGRLVVYKVSGESADTLEVPTGIVMAAFLSRASGALNAGSTVAYADKTLTFTLNAADENDELDLLVVTR